MIIQKEPVWEPCTKEEFDIAMENSPYSLPRPYRIVPIYKEGGGLMDRLEGKEPDEFRYEKIVGWKTVLLLSDDEANDKRLMKILKR